MARKRSLKDAAADQLVEKNKTAPEPPPSAPTKKRAARPAAVKAAPAEPPSVEPPPAEPSWESPVQPYIPLENSKPPGEEKKCRPPSMWMGVALLVGCVAGYFFGVGQTIGPANMSFLLVGLAAGGLLGRLSKSS